MQNPSFFNANSQPGFWPPFPYDACSKDCEWISRTCLRAWYISRKCWRLIGQEMLSAPAWACSAATSSLNTQFLVLNTQFLVLNTQFLLIFAHSTMLGGLSFASTCKYSTYNVQLCIHNLDPESRGKCGNDYVYILSGAGMWSGKWWFYNENVRPAWTAFPCLVAPNSSLFQIFYKLHHFQCRIHHFESVCRYPLSRTSEPVAENSINIASKSQENSMNTA